MTVLYRVDRSLTAIKRSPGLVAVLMCMFFLSGRPAIGSAQPRGVVGPNEQVLAWCTPVRTTSPASTRQHYDAALRELKYLSLRLNPDESSKEYAKSTCSFNICQKFDGKNTVGELLNSLQRLRRHAVTLDVKQPGNARLLNESEPLCLPPGRGRVSVPGASGNIPSMVSAILRDEPDKGLQPDRCGEELERAFEKVRSEVQDLSRILFLDCYPYWPDLWSSASEPNKRATERLGWFMSFLKPHPPRWYAALWELQHAPNKPPWGEEVIRDLLEKDPPPAVPRQQVLYLVLPDTPKKPSITVETTLDDGKKLTQTCPGELTLPMALTQSTGFELQISGTSMGPPHLRQDTSLGPGTWTIDIASAMHGSAGTLSGRTIRLVIPKPAGPQPDPREAPPAHSPPQEDKSRKSKGSGLQNRWRTRFVHDPWGLVPALGAGVALTGVAVSELVEKESCNDDRIEWGDYATCHSTAKRQNVIRTAGLTAAAVGLGLSFGYVFVLPQRGDRDSRSQRQREHDRATHFIAWSPSGQVSFTVGGSF